MLSELLQKLETEHGIAPSQGHGILNTIAMHIKEKFPMVGGMIDNLLGGESSSAGNINTGSITGNVNSNTGDVHKESTLEEIEDMAKSKLGGLFGGNSI